MQKTLKKKELHLSSELHAVKQIQQHKQFLLSYTYTGHPRFKEHLTRNYSLIVT